jgi:hypothetical protein
MRKVLVAIILSHFISMPAAARTYDDLIKIASIYCKNSKTPNIKIITRLAHIEKGYHPPKRMQGMLLAAACSESGYTPTSLGDRRFSKSKKYPMARGILQQWPWWERRYGIDRLNYEQAAHAWMMHIKSRMKKVKKECRIKTKVQLWETAWVYAVRAPKRSGRCHEKVKHLRLLKKWQKIKI